MSRYSAVIVFLGFFLLTSCSADSLSIKDKLSKVVDTKVSQASADFYYMVALDCEYRLDYTCSAMMFEKLYQITHQEEFLKSMTRLSLLSARYDIYKRHINNIDRLAKKDVEIASYLIPYYLKVKNYKKAESLSKFILKKDKSVKNYQLLAAMYIDTKEYKKAQKVLDEYINEYGCEPAICGMKLFLKTKENDIEGTIKLLKRLYKTTKNQAFEAELLKLYLSLGEYDKLEQYVKKSSDLPKDILIDIYTSIKDYKRAEKVSMQLYKETKKPLYLADAAVYLYEAEYKKNPKVLKEVMRRFEKSVSKVDKAVFYNYYGYLLIDHDIDIKKGIKLIKKALSKKPDNEYYLDSLAWGLYKEGKCKKSLKILKSLKDQDQIEIKEHIKKAKECLKR